MTTPHDVAPADEGRHAPDADDLWNESYYCDFVTHDGSLGGWLRLGLYPNLGVAWWTAWIVFPDRPGVCSVDYHMPVPPGMGLATRSDPAVTESTTEVRIEVLDPLRSFRLAAPHMAATRFEHPEDAYQEGGGTPVEASLDLTWATDGVPYHYVYTTRYEIPCLVTGTVTIAGETFTVDGHGQRDHSWGVRDWWAFGWCWNSMRLDDGTRTHLADIRTPEYRAAFGYVQTPQSQPGIADQITTLDVTEELGAHGFPTRARIDLNAGVTEAGEPTTPPRHHLGIDVTPVAFGPVLLRNDKNGRLSRFPRAMVRCRTDDGRTGAGWIEWNQPD